MKADHSQAGIFLKIIAPALFGAASLSMKETPLALFGEHSSGLVIVKRCVDLHGGSVEIDSEVGTGTTFTVRLPLFGK